MLVVDMKECYGCKKTKPATEFRKWSAKCKKCRYKVEEERRSRKCTVCCGPRDSVHVNCAKCLVLLRNIHDAKLNDSTEKPHGHEERIQKYAAMVAAGKRLFEETKQC